MWKKALHALALLVASGPLMSAPGCSEPSAPQTPTTLVLVPEFEASWNLTQLELLSGTHQARWPESPGALQSGTPIRVTLSDPADIGKPMAITVWGLQSENRIARGDVAPTPQANSVVSATVRLALVACTSSCVLGTRMCDGDGVTECVPDGQDGCTAWADPVPCPADRPFCSLGACGEQCLDECENGRSRCAGNDARQSCGQSDSDLCRDWASPQACAAGQSCDSSSGMCVDRTTCADDCSLGEVGCRDNGVATCGQHDADPCLEWGPGVQCPESQTCTAGSCASCAEGQSCNDTDACTVQDQCGGGVCRGEQKVCNAPPPPACLNEWVLRTSLNAGACSLGECEYPHSDTPCPNGCNAGVCLCTDDVVAVPGAQTAGHTSIALTPMNEPFVSFLDVGRALHAAHRDVNGTWVIERIASQARDSSSIATSSSGGVHVALINTSSRLAVASRNGSGDWTVTVVDSTNRQASPRLAIDASGARHVGYIHADDSFNYAWSPATGPWAIESSVASAAGQLTDVSLAVDAQGGVHACFVAQQQPKGVSHYTLEYLYKAPGGSWATKQVDTGYDAVPGSQTGLAVNPNGGVFIAYVDGTKGLQVARASMSAPTSTVTVGAGGALVDARFPSLARDASGVLHLVYASADRVWHTQSTGGDPSGWAPAEAVGFAGAAAGCALAVGTDGTVHASFQDVALTALQYARICP